MGSKVAWPPHAAFGMVRSLANASGYDPAVYVRFKDDFETLDEFRYSNFFAFPFSPSRKLNMATKRILFVCMGNICRSPAAEAVMKRFAEEFVADVDVDSAGTHGYHVGEKADARMLAAAEARGYELTSRGRQVTKKDLEDGVYDLVLAMDNENYRFLIELAGRPTSHIRIFSDYLDDTWPNDVPDPYYGEEDGFTEVLDMLEEGCPLILQTLVGETAFDIGFDE